MLIIQCTKKLAGELKIKLQNIEAGYNPVYAWHANLFDYNQR